ncbi:unnamed protein product, partial [Staurois parvus]
MTHSGPGSSKRRRYRGPWQIRGPGRSYGRPVICQHPMTKKAITAAVCERRPASGTWQSVADGDKQQWEAVQGSH